METTLQTNMPRKWFAHSLRDQHRVHMDWTKPFYLMVPILFLFTSSSFALKSIEGQGPDRESNEKIEDLKSQAPEREDFPSQSSSSSTATIRGSVFYNDQRNRGLCADRRDKNGNPGNDCNDNTDPNPNWLGGKYMVVEVIERDKGFLPTDVNCKKEDVITSATVGSNGSFTTTFSTNDPCKHDDFNHAAIQLRVRLRFCNSSYCFSINKKKNQPYTVSHPKASSSNPMTVRGGADITMSTLEFNTASKPTKPNNISIAANYYASIVDTILFLHKDNPIPFYKEEFGEIQYIFPSKQSETATARSPTKIAISNYKSQPEELDGKFDWIDGKTPGHEYGHILMQRAWDGSYGFNGVGISANDSEKAPSQQIAFKEAWAEFITYVVFQPTRSCSASNYDNNWRMVTPDSQEGCSTEEQQQTEQQLAKLRDDRRKQLEVMEFLQGAGLEAAQEQLASIDAQIDAAEQKLKNCEPGLRTNLFGPLGEGAQWRGNIVKTLCDWYDDRDDDDTNLTGPGDYFSAKDIHSMWFNLRRMYVDADKYGGEFKKPGLWFCDYVKYYLDVRKSDSEVGKASHENYETKIRDLVYNNNIGCFLPAPS